VPASLPPKIRALLATARVLMKIGLMPTPQKGIEKPHAQRLQRKALGLACGSGDQTVRTWDLVVEGRGGPIPVRVYVRPGLEPGAPGYLFIHGGGFVDGGLDFTDYVQRGLAARAGCVVLGLSYRLAPEHPFPAGLEDCQDVLRWMVDTRPQGMDRDRIAVGGESAGANLAAALSIWARDNHGPRISHQAIVYPFTDATLSSPDWDSRLMPGVDRSVGEFMVRVYAGERNAANPLVSILHAEHRGLPPALVVSCEYDPLRTDGIKFAEALKAAGVDTLHRHYNNMPHGYLLFPKLTRTSDDSLDEIAAEAMRYLKTASACAHMGPVTRPALDRVSSS
jgi:acetyl esterase